MTLTLTKGHKESMLQARFTLQRSSTIYWPWSMLGTPKMKGSSSLHSYQRKVPIRPWCNGLKTIWCHSLSSIVTAIVADITIQSPADFMNNTSPLYPSLDFSTWTYLEPYLPATFHTESGFQEVINSLDTPPNGSHQVAMVLALGLMIQDIMHAVEISLDQGPPGLPKWVVSSELTVQHLEELLQMAPVITRLNEW